jgi:DNA-binding MarR family transcriptional regulator
LADALRVKLRSDPRSPDRQKLPLPVCSGAKVRKGYAVTIASESSDPAGKPLARFARNLLASRRRRRDDFPKAEFGEPVWDMLLELYVHHAAGRRLTTYGLCNELHVSATTAFRRIHEMVDAGQLLREPDTVDRRRVYVSLAPDQLRAMETYLRRERERLLRSI